MRRQTAAMIAESLGLTRLYNLRSGIHGWMRAGLELVEGLTVAV